MKIVGTRLDHNLTYEGPVSTWHYESYSAPGQVIKSGDAKFEPPGGVRNTLWVLVLEDANGNRPSENILFRFDQSPGSPTTGRATLDKKRIGCLQRRLSTDRIQGRLSLRNAPVWTEEA